MQYDWLHTMPEADYHAHPALSSSQLRDFHESARLYWQRHCGNAAVVEDTEALRFGRKFHKALLEGDAAFDAAYLNAKDAPVNPTTGKPYGYDSKKFEDWLASVGKTADDVVTAPEIALIKTMARAVRQHPSNPLGRTGIAEHVALATIEGKPCRARIDWFDGRIVDLKTCADIRWFEQDAERHGYAQRLALYRDVAMAASGGEVFDVALVAVEKKPPYAVGVWVVGDDTLNAWSARNRAAIRRLVECEQTNTWPTGYEEIRILGA